MTSKKAKKTINVNDDTSVVKKSKTKILKNLAIHLSDDYQNVNDKNKIDPQIQKVNRLIKNSSQDIEKTIKNKKSSQENVEKKSFRDPEKFNGISNEKEQKTILIEQLKKLERENIKLRHDLELLHEDYQKEKINSKKSVRDLKRELHRTAPLNDNKFFSFSKDLRMAVESVKSLSEDNYENAPYNPGASEESIEVISKPDITITSLLNKKSSKLEKENKVVKKKPKEIKASQDSSVNQEKKSLKSKKASSKMKAVIGGVAVLLLFLTSSAALVLKKPEVDQDLVSNFLEDKEVSEGQVRGAVVELSDPMSREKTEFKHNLIPYEDMEWEIFRDGFLGFQVEYPLNAVDLLHTGNTVTFLRKDSYLYKIQRVQSDESPQEYYERSVGSGGLRYVVEEADISSKDTIHLVLDEGVEFPGNKYIASHNGFIYDIWYATESVYFDEVDMQIIERIIETDKIL